MIEILSRDCYSSPDMMMYEKGGTILKVFIPPGASVNLLNLIEAVSPTGISLIVRIPLGGRQVFNRLLKEVKRVGGTVRPLSKGEHVRYFGDIK